MQMKREEPHFKFGVGIKTIWKYMQHVIMHVGVIGFVNCVVLGVTGVQPPNW